MKNGLVIADSGPIFSLAIIDRLDLLDKIFAEIRISDAVWQEITLDDTTDYYRKIYNYFEDKIEKIKGFNDLTFVMDYGESESVVLYKELGADLLLIDDKKARQIAESLEISCIGTLGLLLMAKKKGILKELRPIFEIFLANKRYYSLNLLNTILEQNREMKIIK